MNIGRLPREAGTGKGIFRLDAPTTKRRRRYCIKYITLRVRCECSDLLTCVPKPTHRVLCRQNGGITDISLPRVSLPRCFATENGNSLLILHAFRSRSSTLIFTTFTYIFIDEK